MGLNSVNLESIDFTPRCLVDVVEDNMEPDSNVLGLLNATQEIGCPRIGASGETLRILKCARCTLITWLEHNKELELVEVQHPDEFRQDCRASEANL